jgi:hypothetical protein
MFQYTTGGSYMAAFLWQNDNVVNDSHEQEEIIGADIVTERQSIECL